MKHLQIYEGFISDRIEFAEEMYQHIVNIFSDPQIIKEIHDKKLIPIHVKKFDVDILFGWYKSGEDKEFCLGKFVRDIVVDDVAATEKFMNLIKEEPNRATEIINSKTFIRSVEIIGHHKGLEISLEINPRSLLSTILGLASIPVLLYIINLIIPDLKISPFLYLSGGALITLSKGLIDNLKDKRFSFAYILENIYLKFPGVFRKLFLKMLKDKKLSLMHELVHLYDWLSKVPDFNDIIEEDDKKYDNNYIKKMTLYVNQGTERNAYFIESFMRFIEKHNPKNYNTVENFSQEYINYLKNDTMLSYLSNKNLNYIFDMVEEFYNENKNKK